MAVRPVFVPLDRYPYFEEHLIEFDWHPGFSISQAQKSIDSLHNSAQKKGINKILEISSKSPNPLGISVSAFNLILNTPYGCRVTVECAFQGSKVFEGGGPFQDLYEVSSIQAKKDRRIRESGNLIAFKYFEDFFPIKPVTAFYDWLYIVALTQNDMLSRGLLVFDAFSDIAFNPKKSLNCQARSAAIFVALHGLGKLGRIKEDQRALFDILKNTSGPDQDYEQRKLFS